MHCLKKNNTYLFNINKKRNFTPVEIKMQACFYQLFNKKNMINNSIMQKNEQQVIAKFSHKKKFKCAKTKSSNLKMKEIFFFTNHFKILSFYFDNK